LTINNFQKCGVELKSEPLALKARSPIEIETGSVLWNMPDRMRVGRRERVEVRIGDASVAEAQLREGLTGRGVPNVDRLEVSSLMRVTLVSDERDFAIKALSSLDQYLRAAQVARWDFDVRPLRAGLRVLRVLVSLRVKVEGKDELVDLPSYEREVHVRVAPLHSTAAFCGKNWQWIAGSVAIPLAVWMAAHTNLGGSIVQHWGILQERPPGETPQPALNNFGGPKKSDTLMPSGIGKSAEDGP